MGIKKLLFAAQIKPFMIMLSEWPGDKTGPCAELIPEMLRIRDRLNEALQIFDRDRRSAVRMRNQAYRDILVLERRAAASPLRPSRASITQTFAVSSSLCIR